LVLFVLIVVLGLVIWSIRRHRDPKLEIKCNAPIGELLPSIAGLTQSAVHEGNSVELLVDGAFFDAMFRDIRSATRSVHFETFLWKDGELGTRLADVLIERSLAGVEVRVLVDADGGKKWARRPRGACARLAASSAFITRATSGTSAFSMTVITENSSSSTGVSHSSAGTASWMAGCACRRITATTFAIWACGWRDQPCIRSSPSLPRTGWRTPVNFSLARRSFRG
jgi:hypothetical protein